MPRRRPSRPAHRTRPARRALIGLAALAVALLAACSSGPLPPNLAGQDGHGAHGANVTAPLPQTPLRDGERFIEVRTPAAYTPTPKSAGSEDTRCFLLDPGVGADALVAGVTVIPGNPNLVRQVFVFTVAPGAVSRAQAQDASDPGAGWSCPDALDARVVGGDLDDTDWLASWVPGSGESLFGPKLGVPLAAGGRLLVQIRYAADAGPGSDQSLVRLRLSPAGAQAVHALLLAAPVELPCRPGVAGELCRRDASVAEVRARLRGAPASADLLHGPCGPVEAGPTQRCARALSHPIVVRAVTGAMSVLGRSISIDVDKGSAAATRVLDIPVWDLTEARPRTLDDPVSVAAGQSMTVTCTHDQALRDAAPATRRQPEQYVLWGAGAPDDLCLGIVFWQPAQ